MSSPWAPKAYAGCIPGNYDIAEAVRATGAGREVVNAENDQ
jgi:hypothetical protein